MQIIKRVFFEPWGLGDALMATSIFREQPEDCAIACSSRWCPILEAALKNNIYSKLIPVNLAYTQKTKKHLFDGVFFSKKTLMEVEQVLSIRGDLRDYFVARQLFPRAQIKMSGWIPFLAGKSSIVNLPYRTKKFPIMNRYNAWCKLAAIPFQQLENTFIDSQNKRFNRKIIIIHAGAYWKSRQYPYVETLSKKLSKIGYDVRILCGPDDSLPYGLHENDILRVSDVEIVNEFKEAQYAITNDSGPMHLAAFIGCKTIAVARMSDINQWLPPGVKAVLSEKMPHGYRPNPYLATDFVMDGWPTPDDIIKTLCAWNQ